MTKTRSKKKDDNAMTNWYGVIPDSLKTKYHNPCFDDHKIKVPFRMMIVGNSGSGKTTLVLELLHRMQDTFGNVILCCQNSDEPLYRFLASKLKPEELQIYEGYENIPNMNDLDKDLQHLIIFDDLVLERKQDKIEEYFIRARKIAKGVSCIYLTQSYYAVPKVIRLQCNYIFLKKISSTRDLNMMMKDFSLGVDREVLHELYKHCTEHRENFLCVDIDSPMENRFRLNFQQVIST